MSSTPSRDTFIDGPLALLDFDLDDLEFDLDSLNGSPPPPATPATGGTATSSSDGGYAEPLEHATTTLFAAVDHNDWLPGHGHSGDNATNNVMAAEEAAARNVHTTADETTQQSQPQPQPQPRHTWPRPTEQYLALDLFSPSAAPNPAARPPTPHQPENLYGAAAPAPAFPGADFTSTIPAEHDRAPDASNIAMTKAESDKYLNDLTTTESRQTLLLLFTADPPHHPAKLFFDVIKTVVKVDPTEANGQFMANVHGAMVIFLTYAWMHHAQIKQMIINHARTLNMSPTQVMYHSIVTSRLLVNRRQNLFTANPNEPLIFKRGAMDERKKYMAVLPLAAILAQVAFWLWATADGPAKLNELLEDKQPIGPLLDILFVMIRSAEAEWLIKEEMTFPAVSKTNITAFLKSPRTVKHLVCYNLCDILLRICTCFILWL